MDVHLVSNVLQQTWPLSGLDFTDYFFWDLSPFILLCLQPLQFPVDKAFITFPTGITLQRNIFWHARSRDRAFSVVLHSNRKSSWRKSSQKSCRWAVPMWNSLAQPHRVSAGSGLQKNMTHFSSLNKNCTASCMFFTRYQTCYMFFITPRVIHVYHVSRISLINKRKNASDWSTLHFNRE